MANITFYGTRGSYSLTSEKYMEFGVATSCVVIRFDDTVCMVDCGSGVNNALDDLQDVNELHLFISHTHFDHISGIVSLLPAFKDKTLHIYGKGFNHISVKDSLHRFTSQSLWPIKADAYNKVSFHELDDEVKLNGITITNMDSNHPDGCSLFRFQYKSDDIVTAFDFCHLNGYDEKLIEFAKGTKTLIYDGFFSEEEFPEKADLGHSTPEEGVKIAKALNVEQLYITHFGVYDDEVLNRWEEKLQEDYPHVSFARSGFRKSDLIRMIDIGSLLNIEKDNDTLLLKIVEACMDITYADGGTLYLLENEMLEFKVMINRSKKMKLVRKTESLGIPAVHLNGKNICAVSAREKKVINIEDCYATKQYDFSGTRKYDELNDYTTKSVLVIPLIDDHDDLIGVLQLINALDKKGNIIAFKKTDELVIHSIANQAAISIEKSFYSSKIDELLYGFVKVMSVGIDERTPYNANHTKNMVRYADTFFEYEAHNHGKYDVDPEKRREILMSIWLHDIGKLLIPLDIMNKDSRLGNLIQPIEARFDRRDLLLRLQKAEGKLTEEEYRAKQEERINQFNLVNLGNLVEFLSKDTKNRIEQLASTTYEEIDGSLKPVITSEEYYQLSTERGTLTKEERAIMETHVSMTVTLLSQLNFPKTYENIPEYAGNHHELLDGSGYPNHLTAKDLSWPCRFIAIIDIFEALTAKDRPYKKPMSFENAFMVLKEMALAGKLDKDIVAEFEKAYIS